MSPYIVLPIIRDPVEAEEQSQEVVRAQWPDWEPSDGDPFTILQRASAVMYADLSELATQMADEGFRYYGRTVAGVPPIDETPATGTVTFTARAASTTGYVVPEGTELTGTNASGELVAFHTLADAPIAAGATVSTSTAVEALEDGTQGNGVSGAGELTEYLDFLASVAFDAPTVNARDREGDEDYLNRLSDELAVPNPPVLPPHFAVHAQRIALELTGVQARATAIDGLNPADGTTTNARYVAVALMAADGTLFDPTVLADVETQLSALREVNFETPVFAPTENRVQATFDAVVYPGWNPADVAQAGIDALTSYLSGATWGQREDTGQGTAGPEWLNEPTVRYLEVAERLQRVEGLRYVNSLQTRLFGGAWGTADLALTGYAPIPTTQAGDVTGTAA